MWLGSFFLKEYCLCKADCFRFVEISDRVLTCLEGLIYTKRDGFLFLYNGFRIYYEFRTQSRFGGRVLISK